MTATNPPPAEGDPWAVFADVTLQDVAGKPLPTRPADFDGFDLYLAATFAAERHGGTVNDYLDQLVEAVIADREAEERGE